jgi:hypothetical protein
VIGQLQAAGSKRQRKRRYLRHQLVVAAAPSHVTVASFSYSAEDIQSAGMARLWDVKTSDRVLPWNGGRTED